MAITSGFFNSLNGDRKYDARQMGEMFDGLIEDGVFMSIGDALKTVPSSGMTVAVGTGRAWFLHTWTKNDSDHLITVSAAESVLNRIDTIVLDIDNTEATRDNDIVLVKGTPSSNPKRPTLIDADDHKQIPLADILVPAGSTALTATNITNIVGTSECPYVTGPLSIIKNDDILEAWQEEFDTWFDGVKGTLGSDTAGNLYNLIQQKVDKTSVLDTMDEVELTTEEGYVAGALAVKELNGKTSQFFSAAEADSIEITAPYDCAVEITHTFLGWGYAGNLFVFGIMSSSSGITKKCENFGGCQGGDIVNKYLRADAVYAGLKKGQKYTFSRQDISGGSGANNNRKWTVICHPE